jgi:hypothetical protein
MSVAINGAGSITGIDQGFNITSGSVGIGTDVVGDKLVIHQGSDDDVIVRVNGADSSSEFAAMGVGSGYAAFVAGGTGTTNTDMVLMTSPSGVETERLRISSSGNVGINDTSPAALFTVNNGTNDSQCVFIKNDNVGAYFGTYGTGHASYPREVTINGTRTDGGSSPFLRIAGQGGIKFCVDLNTERLRIGSDGKVLIGSDTGSVHGDRLLQVGKTDRSQTYVSITSSTSGVCGLLFADTTTNDTGGYRGQIRYEHSSDSMDFRTGATERLRIDSNGHLLHGVTADEDTSGNGGLRFINSGDIQIDGDQKALVFRSTNNTAQLQSAIEWWNENGAGVQSKIACDRTAVSQAPSDLVFYTSPNVDTGGTSSDGSITERLRIKSNGHIHIGNPIELANVATTTHTFALSGNSDNTFSCPGSVSISGATAYNTANYAGGGIRFLGKYNASGQYTTFAHMGGIKENTIDGNYAGALTFHTRNHGGLGAERMRISSNGQVTMPNQPCFWATSNTGGSDTSNGYTGIISNQMEAAYVNIGNHYNTSTGVFTCPVAGTYEFHGQGLIRHQTGVGRGELTFYKNGSNTISRSYGYTYITGASDHDNLHVMAYITCAVNDQIDLRVYAMDSGIDCYFAQGLGYFAGRLVQ